MSRISSSSYRDAKSSPGELHTHVTPVETARWVVVFRVALTVADQEPITGASREFRHHLGVKAGRVSAVNTTAAAVVLLCFYARAQTTLEQVRTGGSEKRDARVVGVSHYHP